MTLTTMKPGQQEQGPCTVAHNSVAPLNSTTTTTTAAVASSPASGARLEPDRGLLLQDLIWSLQSAFAMTESDDDLDEERSDKKSPSHMRLDKSPSHMRLDI